MLQANAEVAKSQSGGIAQSLVLSGEAARLQWTAESHSYSRNFHNPHGRAFNAMAAAPQNERGYSFGLSSRLQRGMVAEIFLAQRQDLWRTPRAPLPGAQVTTGARWEWQPRQSLTLQLRWQQTRENEIAFATASQPAQQRGRFRLDYQATPQLRLTARFDFVRPAAAPETARENGLALSQEAQYKFQSNFQLTARYTLFDTPAAAPIYQYEHDLPGVFTSFALRERGRRAYIYLRYWSAFGVDLSVKWAATEREQSLFSHTRSYSWGAQIDWRLSRGDRKKGA